MRINKNQEEVITFLVKRLKGIYEKWAITGSFGQALQGIDIEPADIDIISTQNGVWEIQSIFREFIKQEVHYSKVKSLRSYFGVMEINSCRVEFFGEIENLLSNNSWESHIGWEKNITEVIIDKIKVPVLTLEYELLVCQKLFKLERASLIEMRIILNQKRNG